MAAVLMCQLVAGREACDQQLGFFAVKVWRSKQRRDREREREREGERERGDLECQSLLSFASEGGESVK